MPYTNDPYHSAPGMGDEMTPETPTKAVERGREAVVEERTNQARGVVRGAKSVNLKKKKKKAGKKGFLDEGGSEDGKEMNQGEHSGATVKAKSKLPVKKAAVTPASQGSALISKKQTRIEDGEKEVGSSEDEMELLSVPASGLLSHNRSLL